MRSPAVSSQRCSGAAWPGRPTRTLTSAIICWSSDLAYISPPGLPPCGVAGCPCPSADALREVPQDGSGHTPDARPRHPGMVCPGPPAGWPDRCSYLDPVDPYRGGRVRAYPRAERAIVQGELGRNVVIHGARNTQTATLGHAFQARRQVDCRPVDPLLLHYDIPQMEA